jgi:hypothetical protein
MKYVQLSSVKIWEKFQLLAKQKICVHFISHLERLSFSPLISLSLSLSLSRSLNTSKKMWVICAPDDYSRKNTQKYFKQFQSLIMITWLELWITDGVIYWRRSSRIWYGVSINVWRLAGGTLNITCKFLCYNRQAPREFLITLYNFLERISTKHDFVKLR